MADTEKAKTGEEVLLKLSNLSYSYEEEFPVLKDVSLEIRRGEKIAVLGANGAGKSTLFLCMNGVLSPQCGELSLNGEPVGRRNLKELRKKVGIVFQDADSQIVASTVMAEVAFGPANLRLPREEVVRRTAQALTDMNLHSMADRPPHYLSGGEKKRVTIADIIAMEPDIIIFDEPTTALDPANQQILETIFDRLEKQGKTLMVSTHDVNFAYRFATRILVFSEGRLIADGPALEIFLREEILRASSLKKPVLLEIYELLVQKKLMNSNAKYPKTLEELSVLL